MNAFDDLRRAHRRAKLPMPRNLEFLYPLLTVGALLLGWQLWVSVGHVPEYLFPTIPEVWHKLMSSHELFDAAWTTTKLILEGFAFAVLLGVGLAALVVMVKPFEIGFYPILVSTQFVPLIALAPLFVIWFGFGDTSQIVIIMLFSYFAIFISTLTGLRSIQLEKIYLARTIGAGPIQTFVAITLPNALPRLFAGLKIGVTSAVIGAVVAQFSIGARGVGALILRASGLGDSATLIAGVVYLGLIGAILFAAVGLAERLAIPWHVAQRTAASRKS